MTALEKIDPPADPPAADPPAKDKIAWIQKQIRANRLDVAAEALEALGPDTVEPHLMLLTRALLAEAEGDQLSWLTHSAAAYAADAGRPACYGNYALMLQALGKSELADEVVRRAMAEAPRTSRPHYWRARLSEQQKNLQGALAGLTKALKYAPGDLKSRRYRMDLLLKDKQYAAARSDLEHLQRAGVNDKALYRTGVSLARTLGDSEMEMAQSVALIAVSNAVGDLRDHITRLFKAEAYDEVLPFLRASVVEGPEAVSVCASAAEQLERHGRHDDAIKAMDMAIKKGGKPKLRVSKARMLERMGRATAAERLLRRILKDFPAELQAPRQLVKLLLSEGRPEAALRVITQVQEVLPSDVDLALDKARALKALARLDAAAAALDDLRAAVDLDTKTTLIVAKFYAELGQREVECQTLDAALARDPRQPQVLEYMLRRAIGYIPRPLVEPQMHRLETWAETEFPDHLWRKLYMQSLDFDAAAEARRSGAPQDATAANDLAKILIASHRYPLALRYLRLCRRRWPGHKALMTQSFDALVRFGRIDEARALLEDSADMPVAWQQRCQLTLDLYDRPGRRFAVVEDAVAVRDLPVKSLEVLLRNTLATADLTGAERLHAALKDKNAESIARSWWSSYLGQIVMEMQLLAQDYGLPPGAPLELPDDAAKLRAEMRNKSWSTVLASALITRTVDAGYLTTLPAEQRANAKAIPKCIYQYWNAKPSPAVLELSKSWARVRGYDYQMFDRASALTFLRDTCGPRWVQAFRLARRPEEEADFLRLALLARKGGIWADADDRLYGDLDQLIPDGAGLVLFREPAANAIGNNFIAVRPGHPVIQVAERWVMQGILQRSNEKLWLKSGPGMMMRAVAWYIAEVGPETAARDLLLPGQEVLRREVSIHNRLDHKMTDKYWNSKLRRDPGYMDLLNRLMEVAGDPEVETPEDADLAEEAVEPR